MGVLPNDGGQAESGVRFIVPGNWNSGRRKQAPGLQLLRGNPGRRPVIPAAAPVETLSTTPPPELDGHTRAGIEWRRIAPFVSRDDHTSAVALCLEWAAYLDAKAQLRQADMKPKKAGVKRLSPYVVMADRALSNCLRLWNELALTPSARARTKVPPAHTPPASKWGNHL